MSRRFTLGSSFGVMQGRLSEQTDRGYQAFPWETWQAEFGLAAERRMEHIEWVLDSWQVGANPILKCTGAVATTAAASGVAVVSVCADYLMDCPLDVTEPESWAVLKRLLCAMQELKARWLVIPCVDQSSLRSSDAQRRFLAAADPLRELLAGTGVEVALETDLGPREFTELLTHLDDNIFGVNYDIGNSASLGYSPDEEFAAYGERVSLVHVKDRLLGGGSVFLGQGSAEIPKVIGHLQALDFVGPVTMQAARDIPGLELLDLQLAWLDDQLGGDVSWTCH